MSAIAEKLKRKRCFPRTLTMMHCAVSKTVVARRQQQCTGCGPIMDIANQEQAFSDKIDCKFPYSDASKAAALIAEARSISTNAEFCVLYEIIAQPASEGLPKHIQRELLAAWIENARSPLAARIAELASQIIDGGKVPTEKALDEMHEVAATEG
jgi:hypothetical protein